jgi:putative two-component system response regulator
MDAITQADTSAAQASILVVDDEAGPRESLRMILAPDFSVETATGASDALEMLRTRDFDVVTVDLNMPGIKGEQLIRSIKEEFPHTAVIVITGCASVESAVQGIRLGVSDYLTKPFDVVAVLGSVQRAITELQGKRRLVGFLEGIGDVLGRERTASEMLGELADDPTLQDRLRDALSAPALGGSVDANETTSSVVDSIAVLEVLAATIEQRDAFMLGHSRRVAHMAALLSERLNLAAEERALVRIASFMHDIGKVGVSSDVIQSDNVLDGSQRRHLEEHPGIGERLVRPLGFSGCVAASIRHHHERWDGRGYPDGLLGEEIPLGARIIAVADAFDTMTCTRPYQPAREEEGALAELEKEAGRKFDPQMVEHFIGIIRAGAALLEMTEDGSPS